jgi:uroporphyrinogen decarboxylase
MTPRENLLRAMRRQGFESVPVASGGFCPAQLEAFKKRFGHDDIEGWFGNPFRGVGLPSEPTCADARALYTRETLPADTAFDAWGVGHSHQPGCWHMTRMHHPLQGEAVTVDEIRRYPMARNRPDRLGEAQSAVRKATAGGWAAQGSMACTIWERSWYLRSMEDLMTDMMLEDERAAVLLDRVMEIAIERITLYAKAGLDIVELGDDIGMQQTTMMSVDLWRTWLKPRLKRVIAAGRAAKPDLLIFYHSCGFVLPFLDELIEIGVDILNPVQPECMDFAEVHRRVGGRISYWGTIGTQQVLPFGTPDEVRETVWRNLRICGPQGGILIAPTHLVEPEVPWENLVAMRDAAREFKLD